MTSTTMTSTTTPTPTSINPIDLKVGQQVDIESRTWPGINKPGGHATITKLHYDTSSSSSGGGATSATAVPTKIDVKYVLGGSEKQIELTYVKPHVELVRGGRSRRVDRKMTVDSFSISNNMSEKENNGGSAAKKKKSGGTNNKRKKMEDGADKSVIKKQKKAVQQKNKEEGGNEVVQDDEMHKKNKAGPPKKEGKKKKAAVSATAAAAAAAGGANNKMKSITSYFATSSSVATATTTAGSSTTTTKKLSAKAGGPSKPKETTTKKVKKTTNPTNNNNNKPKLTTTNTTTKKNPKLVKYSPNSILAVRAAHAKSPSKSHIFGTKTIGFGVIEDPPSISGTSYQVGGGVVGGGVGGGESNSSTNINNKKKRDRSVQESLFPDEEEEGEEKLNSAATAVSSLVASKKKTKVTPSSSSSANSNNNNKGKSAQNHKTIQSLYKNECVKAQDFVKSMVGSEEPQKMKGEEEEDVTSSPESCLELKMDSGRMELFNSLLSEVMFRKGIESMNVDEMICSINTSSRRGESTKPFTLLEVKAFLETLDSQNRIFVSWDEDDGNSGTIYSI